MRTRWTVAVLLGTLVLAGLFPTQNVATAADAGPAVILDTAGVWHMYHTLKVPVVLKDGALFPIPITGAESRHWKVALADDTAPPPDGWTAPDFDDRTWLRGTAARSCRTPFLARLCLRGKFTVTDPAQVGDLTLAVDYHGGIIVTLNGREVAHRDIAPNAPADDPLANPYPEEAYVSGEGELLDLRGNMRFLTDGLPEETQRRYGLRTRRLSVLLPKDQLRDGLNVVGIEIVRAPYDKVLEAHQAQHEYKSKDMTFDLSWNTCQIESVQLTAAAPGGLVPNAVRPAGYQVWNSEMMSTDYDLDFGDTAESPGPIRIVCPRGGAASGKVVVGSDQPIRGLRATAGELKTDGGATIAATAVRIRYALPWSGNAAPLTTEGNFETVPYPAAVDPLVALSDAPLDEFPVRAKPIETRAPTARELYAAKRYGSQLNIFLRNEGQPQPVFGAVAPVWVTVSVPPDAQPGLYTGRLTINAGGAIIAEVPIELTVAGFTLNEPGDYRTWVELVQSPDTLAAHYGLKMWSDRHFQMIAKSLKYLHDVGNRVVYVPLIAQTNLGNSETMVRWIRRDDGTYDFDFSVMDRYLDLVAEHMGTPHFVVFNVWDQVIGANGAGPRSFYSERAAGNEPLVTVLNPATGETENIHLKPYQDANGKEQWGRLFAQLRERMRKRGIEQAMVLGMLSDIWPSKEQTAALKEITGDLPWSIAAHGGYWKQDRPLHEIARIAYHAHAFATQYGIARSLMGWKQSQLHTSFERWGIVPSTPLARWRSFAEIAVTGSVRGVARVGADFWSVEFKDRRGRVTRAQVWARYPEADLKQLMLKTTTLLPGPDGPVAGTRYEAFREGLQEAEARIVIEAALSDEETKKKLDPALAERCERMLTERLRCMWRSVSVLQFGPDSHHSFAAWRAVARGVSGYAWYLGSGWQQRSADLFRAAGEVQQALGHRTAPHSRGDR